MGTIAVSLPADGTTAEVADYNTPITTIVDEINGGLDNANIATGAAIAGSKLADASVTSAKMAAMDIQNITTDTTITAPLFQHGWTFDTAGASDPEVTKTITFPTAYSAAPIVMAGSPGIVSGSDPTAITSFNAYKGKLAQVQAYSVTTTGCVLVARLGDGTNFTSGERVGLTWIAIGPA